MLGGVAAHQDDAGTQRQQLLHQDLDVATVKEGENTHSCSCVSSVLSEAYW